MAYAEIVDPTRPKRVTVALTLSQTECEVLLQVLSHVGGSPDHSPRKYCDDIHRTLLRTGITFTDQLADLASNYIDFAMGEIDE